MSLQSFYEQHKGLTVGIVIVVLAIAYSTVVKNSSYRYFTNGFDGNFVTSQSGAPAMMGGVEYTTMDAAMDKVMYGEESVAATRAMLPPSPEPGGPYGSGDDIVIDEAKIIKTANMDLEVDSVDNALEGIANIAKNLGGEVNYSSTSEDDAGNRYGSMTVKVPVDTFDQARSQIKEISVFVKNENINTSDVTEQFIDIEARLKNLKAEEQSYLTLLSRATRVEDIITITNRLTTVRSQIESTEGRKRYLEGQTDMSTIHISLSEEHELTQPTKKWRPIVVIQDAMRNTIEQFKGFYANVIEFIFWTIGSIPYLIIAGLVYLGYRRFKR